MNRVEERLITTGARYLTSRVAWHETSEEANAWETDARDAYWTARDAAGPDHEHRWITDHRLCERVARSICVTCGAGRDEP